MALEDLKRQAEQKRLKASSALPKEPPKQQDATDKLQKVKAGSLQKEAVSHSPVKVSNLAFQVYAEALA